MVFLPRSLIWECQSKKAKKEPSRAVRVDGGPEIWGKEEIFSLPFAQNTKRRCTVCGVGSERQS